VQRTRTIKLLQGYNNKITMCLARISKARVWLHYYRIQPQNFKDNNENQ